MIVGSGLAAAANGHSLALIRPRKTRFYCRRKSPSDVEAERDAFRRSANQTSLFDRELAEIEPSPVQFRFSFEDDAGPHKYECGDWETHAMYWNWKRDGAEEDVLKRMESVFNEEYPKNGMVFAIGNLMKRPQTWQLLGVIRLNEVEQGELF
jgi:hypothetical protein